MKLITGLDYLECLLYLNIYQALSYCVKNDYSEKVMMDSLEHFKQSFSKKVILSNSLDTSFLPRLNRLVSPFEMILIAEYSQIF